MRSTHRVSSRQVSQRRGVVAVILSLLLIPLLAFTAFCVDVGWITSTQSELQNAADAAATAGAAQLIDNYSAYNSPLQQNRQRLINAAKQSAATYSTTYASYNGAGDVASLTMLAGDIQVGFTDANGNFQASYAGYPNTVQVVARRDGAANNRLPLFFGRILGTNDQGLTASASATVYAGLVNSFNPHGGGDGAWGSDYDSSGGGFDCLLLPVAFDVYDWIKFTTTAISPDDTFSSDGNGTPQIHIYPSPKTAPGNFGMLCIGPDTNSNSTYKEWILNGPSADDLQFLIDNGQFPVSQTNPVPWKASPGLRSALRSDFAAIIGQPRLLPLFKPASTSPYQAARGNGSNATYDIVGFVGVTVTSVSGSGNNLDIKVQPCDVVDPTAVFDPATIFPLGAEPAGQLKSFTHISPKLTR